MEQLLKQFYAERAEIAHSALMQSGDPSLYKLGKLSGMYQALTKVIEAIEQSIAGAEEEET